MLLSPTVLLRQVTVLVVDDEESLRRYISRVMEDAGYDVLTASNGIHALSVLQGSRVPVQLVITDVSMPVMTGPELAERIATTPHPPRVLFISGGHASVSLPGPLLRKPFLPRDLNRLVKWLLRQGRVPAGSPAVDQADVTQVPALLCAS
jgi:two-component system, cell cycle sensor histidine kinase and response regulator CckA